MIKLQLGNEPLALTFKHVRYEDDPQYFFGSPTVAVTYAYIYGLDEEGKMKRSDNRGAGVAFCAKGDNFDKEKGRRVALRKAVSRWPRELRKQVFGQYDSRPRGEKE